MVCIYCLQKTSVINSRTTKKNLSTWRRRECLGCGAIFTTNEDVDLEKSVMVEKGGALEPFIRDFIFMDVHQAISHRKTSIIDSKHLTDEIIRQSIAECNNGVIASSLIKQKAYQVISNFDPLGGSVYKAQQE